MEETKVLQEEFAEKVKAFLQETYSSDMELTGLTIEELTGLTIEELYEDIVQEIQWQIADWYEATSYYGKPEDIFIDYLQLSSLDAHRFLPLFTQNCEGKDSCPL